VAENREDRRSSAPPAPRGSSPSSPPPSFRPSWRWIVFGLALLALNFYVGSQAMQPPSRVRVPYSPFFLAQVRAGNVSEIRSKGTAIQGTFTRQVRYAGSKPTTRFRTEVPAFADNDRLSRLLEEKRVVVNAEPLDTGAPWWQNLLLGFGPTLLFVFLLFWLMRGGTSRRATASRSRTSRGSRRRRRS
jgi:cell division protease FtsH